MKLPVRIAVKYIYPFRSFHFITVITTLSLIGIIVGVAAIICVTSIFNGFREFAENQLLSFDPHIRIAAQKGAWINNCDSINELLKCEPGIKASASVIQGRTVILKGSNLQVSTLNAVRQKDFRYVSGIDTSIILGRFLLRSQPYFPTIVIGAFLADKLHALPGDTLTLMSPALIETAILSLSSNVGVQVRVAGIFQTNNREYDESYLFASFDVGQNLFKLQDNTAFSIDIRINDISEVNKIKAKLEKKFRGTLIVQSWYDLHKDLYDIMKLERVAAFVVLSLIIIIAAFNVLASLSMTVVEKHKDIGVLKSSGAKDSLIRNIYMITGIFIGLISTVIGALLGLGLCYGQIKFSWYQLDKTKFLISAVPVSVHYSDVILVVIFSLFLSLAASIYPAHKASKLLITNAIREE